ncbi:MAG: hypothetical protein H7249_05005 [Chitinophagaceae bacterium]|nr:hypothetical protein [Oligoflexus sp.]
MKYRSILLFCSLISSTLFAASFDKRDAVQELVQKLEAIDPNIKTHQDDWSKVRAHLEQAAQQSESTAGLKLSVQHILDQWGGLHFRVLDHDDAQFWALNGEPLALPNAWFSQRGSKWIIQYSGNPKLNRGNSVAAKDFSPYSKDAQAKAKWELALQTKVMSEPKATSVSLTKQPLSEWALSLTQSSSATVIVDSKRVCIEKVWFWLTKAVAQNIASKIDSKTTLCQGVVLDLRDVFGEGLDVWPKLSGKMPFAVLTNHSTREGAVSLVRVLKQDAKARIFGEPTEASNALQKKEPLQKSGWALIVVGEGDPVVPDTVIKDSYLNAEGVDDVRESGLGWLRKELIK